MTKLALVFLLLPIAQEDPQVTYREGLFEEVDQGNLDKAVELYAKVLKSAAPDALKAKALFRTGSCHEKKGKKQEAEQAWRDVSERFPGAAETIRLARERLAGLKQDGGGTSASLEAQIQSLVLELVSPKHEEREGAIRKLVVIGRPALPELRQALQSRDRELKVNAAHILVQLEEFDGVYDGLKPLWPFDDDRYYRAAFALGLTLKALEEDRAKFLKDLRPEHYATLVPKISGQLATISDPAFPKIVEDWLVNADYSWDQHFRSWTATRDVTEIRRMAKRLADSKLVPNEKVVAMLMSYATVIKQPDPELKQALLAALQGHPTPGKLMIGKERRESFPWWILTYMSPSEFTKGPLTAWFLRGQDTMRGELLQACSRTIHEDQTRDLAKELRRFLLDFVTSPQHPMDIRCHMFAYTSPPESEEGRQKFLEFCHQVLKEKRAKSREDHEPLPEAVRWLLQYLPADSKALAEVMDIACQHACISLDAVQTRQAELRGPAVAAALRGLTELKSAEGPRSQHLAIIDQFATPIEKLGLAPVIAAWPPETEIKEAIDLYLSGLTSVPEADQESAWKSLRENCEQAPAHIQPRLVERFVGMEGDRVMSLMMWAATSKNGETRLSAIRHCGAEVQVHPSPRIQTLVKGLKDPVENIQMEALIGLSHHPDLDAVPEIIGSLNSPFTEVRKQARKSLDEIKKHFEAQAEWKRWYDETKKALGK